MMKRIILFLILISISLGISQNNELQLAIRNIKLGNSYREGRDFDNAAKYISLGLSVTKKFKGFDGKYWTAAAYESLGYLYRDMGLFEDSRKQYKLAINIYREIIKQSDGSQYAMIEILNRISEINNTEFTFSNNNIDNNNAISLVGMKMKDIPNDIPQNLKSLILKDNRFRCFPANVSSMKELKYLDLSNNRIRNVNFDFSNLKYLHYLDLSNNKIKELPNSISNLQNLQELNLEGNKFKTINYNICSLKNLKLLNIRKNKIKFQEILQLVKCLPNTNIIFDKYELVVDEEEAIEGE